MATTAADAAHMRRAIQLAEQGWGRVHPNPLVGAVLVRDGEVVGEGHHAEFGGPHAEIVALAAADDRARGSTLYVTLEPCAHHGKTPPCVDAVIRSGVTRVVIGAPDPHPEAAGGARRLEEAGVDVTSGLLCDRIRSQNALFFHTVETGRPFVALKYGLTLDAGLALGEGERTRVTGVESEKAVHRLRAGFDAIAVGIGTALCDDPLLTVRGELRPRRPPVRLVVDTDARLPVDGRLARSSDEAPVWVACADDAPSGRRAALEAAGVRMLPVARGAHGGVSLCAVLDELWRADIRSVLCEGGGRLGAALIDGGLVQRLYLFYAPRLFGPGGVAAFPGLSEGALDSWRCSDVRIVGEDALLMVDRMERSSTGG